MQGPPERLAVHLLAPLPHGITAAGRLDLDDIGAEIGEQPRAEWCSDEMPQFDDPKAREQSPIHGLAHYSSPSAGPLPGFLLPEAILALARNNSQANTVDFGRFSDTLTL